MHKIKNFNLQRIQKYSKTLYKSLQCSKSHSQTIQCKLLARKKRDYLITKAMI